MSTAKAAVRRSEFEAHVFAERTRTYLDRSVAASISSPLGTLLLAWIQASVAGWQTALLWFCLVQVCECLTITHGYVYRRKGREDEGAETWANRQVVLHCVTGLAWGSSALLFHVAGETTLYLVNLLVLTAVTALCITVMSPYRRAVLLFAASTWLLPLVQLLTFGSLLYLQLAIGVLILMALEAQYAWVANRQLVAGLESAARLREMASRDDLTGAYNRRYAIEQLEHMVAMKSRYGHGASLVLFDLDHFKAVNDSHGHATGDAVLREVAARVRGTLREGDVFARFGGEEFVALLPITDLSAAAALAERLRRSLSEQALVLPDDTGIFPRASFGVAELGAEEEAAAWLARADQALYRAKNAGRDRVEADGELLNTLRRIV